MKRKIYRRLILTTLSFALIFAFAVKTAAIEVDALKERASKAVQDFVRGKSVEYKNAEIVVSFKYSDSLFERIKGFGDSVSFVVLDEYSSYKPVGNVVLPAKVRAKGRADEKVYLRAKISIIEDVISARRTIRKKEIISEDDIEFIKKDIAKYPYRFFVEKSSILGKQATSTISKGAVLADWMIRIPPIVERNDNVSIVVNVGDVIAEAQGIALEDGAIGEEIKVRNVSSKKEIKAVVVDSGKVKAMIF